MLCVALLGCAGVLAEGSYYEAGNSYYEAGEYAQVLAEWKLGVQAGDATAMERLGYLYHYGKGVEQSCEKATYWYEKSANGGNATALRNNAVLYHYGNGVELGSAYAHKPCRRRRKASHRK